MHSNHTGDPASFNATISFPTDGDPKKITPIRSALDRLLDNDAYLNATSLGVRLTRAVQLRTLYRAGDTIDDTTDSLAAIQLGELALVLKADTGGVFQVMTGIDRYAQAGVFADITGSVKGVASYGGAIVAFGVGTNHIDVSGDNGATWTAGANPGISGARCRIVADPDNSRFILSSPSSTSVRNSIDAASWGSHATGLTTGVAALAQIPFNTLALSQGSNALAHSSDGGTTWSAVTGFPANSGSFDESGSIIGDYTNSKVWHVARLSSGVSIQVSSAVVVGGTATWTVRATLTAASLGLSDFGERPRIFCCPDTGLIVVVGRANGTTVSYAVASLDGITWGSPGLIVPGADFTVDAFAVAGGRLFATTDAQLFASDSVAS
jgi:hypothetical protein